MTWHSAFSKKLRDQTQKYRSRKVTHAGYSFDSKSEAALYDRLLMELRAGRWKELRPQVCVYLTNARIQYRADFLCITPENKEIYMEMKGFETPMWRIKRRLWLYYGPSDLQIWNYDHRKKELVHKETICPKDPPGINPP